MKPTPEQVAATLGCTPEQAKAGLLRTAKEIRAYTERDLWRWGKTRQEADAIAEDYERRARL